MRKSLENYLYDLLCIGEPIVDYFMHEQEIPSKTLCSEGVISISKSKMDNLVRYTKAENIFSGGSAFNTARWFSTSGNYLSSFFGPLGCDSISKYIREDLTQHKIINLCTFPSQATSRVCAIIHKNKQRSFLFHNTLNNYFPIPSSEILNRSRIIHLEGYMLRYPHSLLTILQTISPRSTLSIDLGSWNLLEKHKSLFYQLLDRANIIFGNDKEYRILSQSPEDFIKTYSSNNKIFVCTNSDKNILVAHNKIVQKFHPPQMKVIDSTGAGDAFSGGFLSKYLETNTITEAVNKGLENAASTLSQLGAKPSL